MIEVLLQAERALVSGLVDQAERLYAQVAAADPRNSIAVVGLARVALERGHDRAALEHARRALAIDPANPAAQHLVMRLQEVLGASETAAAAPAGPAPTEPAEPVEPPLPTEPSVPSEPTSSSRPGLIGRLLGRGGPAQRPRSKR